MDITTDPKALKVLITKHFKPAGQSLAEFNANELSKLTEADLLYFRAAFEEQGQKVS